MKLAAMEFLLALIALGAWMQPEGEFTDLAIAAFAAGAGVFLFIIRTERER